MNRLFSDGSVYVACIIKVKDASLARCLYITVLSTCIAELNSRNVPMRFVSIAQVERVNKIFYVPNVFRMIDRAGWKSISIKQSSTLLPSSLRRQIFYESMFRK